jgi:membrane protein YdbS with pleckstrin-like domain
MADEEVDVWWGSYAPRAMLPSFVVCLVLSVLIDLVCWLLLPRGAFLRWSVVGLTGLVWLVQLFRWLRRVLGYNYRLTDRRLFVEHGLVAPVTAEADLSRVKSLKVGRSYLNRLLGVGRLAVYVDDDAQLPLILDGVRRPGQVRDLIARQAAQTKKSTPSQPPFVG